MAELQVQWIELEESALPVGSGIPGAVYFTSDTRKIFKCKEDGSFYLLYENKLTKNDDIEGGTACKVKVDSKGLVTNLYDLSIGDIPELPTSKIAGLPDKLKTLDSKADKTVVDDIVSKIPTEASSENQLVSDSSVSAALANKQDTLIAGEGINIEGNVISSTAGTSVKDVQINSISIKEDNVANIATKSEYNKSTNKIATESDVPTKVSQLENDKEFITYEAVEGKQDKINDLSTIRQGAAKGMTALQEHQSLEGLATTEYVDTKTTGKQNSLNTGIGLNITSDVEPGRDKIDLVPLITDDVSTQDISDRQTWNETNSKKFISAYFLDKAVKAALTDAHGITYTAEEQAAARGKIGAGSGVGTVLDVQANNVSIVDKSGIAKIPVASTTELGLIKSSENVGLVFNDGKIEADIATTKDIDARTTNKLLTSDKLDNAVKSALVDESFAYADDEKEAARDKIGAQGKLTAGPGISIVDDVISASGVEVTLKTINSESLVGEGNIELPTLSTVQKLLETKVDAVEGKGLSTNDFTDTYKNYLAPASKTTMGIVRIGDGINVTSDGIISKADPGYAVANIATTDWTAEDTHYVATLTVSGLKASSHPHLDILVTDPSTLEAAKLAFSKVYRAVATENTLKVFATELPTTDLTIQVEGF